MHHKDYCNKEALNTDDKLNMFILFWRVHALNAGKGSGSVDKKCELDRKSNAKLKCVVCDWQTFCFTVSTNILFFVTLCEELEIFLPGLVYVC